MSGMSPSSLLFEMLNKTRLIKLASDALFVQPKVEPYNSHKASMIINASTFPLISQT